MREGAEDEITQLWEGDEWNNLIKYEKISYLICVSKSNSKHAPGVLITFQEGLEGDVYGGIKELLQDNALNGRGVSHLFMQLVRASIESAIEIEEFIENVLDAAAEEAQNVESKKNKKLQNAISQIRFECQELLRTMKPFLDTMTDLVEAKAFPASIIGSSVASWKAILVSLKRLDENIRGYLMFIYMHI